MTTKKKTTAKAAPAKGKAKATKTVMLKVGDIWTHPDSGKKYVAEVGECDETCAFGSKGKNCNVCQITRMEDGTKHPICTENGVHLVEMDSKKPVKGKKTVEKGPSDDGRRYELVEVQKLKPSPYQTRKDGDVSDLAASIRTYGVLNPVTVRMVDDEYELIAGHRRWKGAVEAELTLIPAIVIECDDQTAAEMCVTENMQRKGLSPIEEAEGVNALIHTKHTLDDIANRLGRTRQWVARRASLVFLMPGIRARVEKSDDTLSQAPVEVLEIMSRMPWAAQEKLLAMFVGGSSPSVAMMRARAAALMCSLKNPPFALKECQACTKRTGASLDLFDQVDGKLGNCLDADCYGEKVLTAKKLLVEELRNENADVVIVSRDWQLQQKITGLQSMYAHTECPKDTPDAVPAVEIKEDGNVRNFFVHKPVEHKPVEHKGATSGAKAEPEPYDVQVKKRVVKTVEEWLNEWSEKLDGKCADEDTALKTPFNTMAANGLERNILRMLAAFGMNDACCEHTLEDEEGYNGAPIDSLMRKLFQDFADMMGNSLGYQKVENAYPSAVIIAEECGFATEKQLLDLAKSGLELDGIKNPADKPAKKGKAK